MPEIPSDRECDVLIIGAGLAGTCLAGALQRQGRDVVLVDTQAVYPYEFRAEKLADPQMALFDGLGFGHSARAVATPVDVVDVVRHGSIFERQPQREYGFVYHHLINRLRADLPAGVPITIGRVEELRLDERRSRVVLKSGQVFGARLVVVATGLGDVVRRKAGIGRVMVSERHSLSIGFTMRSAGGTFPFEALTYYAETFGDRAAYLTLFPIGSQMRANLFVYREAGDPWTKAFRAEPEKQLDALMPKLRRFCPDLAIEGPVEIRPMDIARADDVARPGLVVVGDAFQTPCPIPGTGIGKALTDIDRLCRDYAPRWLAADRITVEDVAGFYADEVKAKSDADSIRTSLYARSIGTDGSLAWRTRRLRNKIGRHVLHEVYRARTLLRHLRPAIAGSGGRISA